MTEMQALPKDDPRIVAWEAYKQTDEFANSVRWARDPSGKHLIGSMWAGFLAGFEASRDPEAAKLEEMREALKHARGAIASLEEGELGYVEPQGLDEGGWPIQAELLHMIDAALGAANTPERP